MEHLESSNSMVVYSVVDENGTKYVELSEMGMRITKH